MSDAVTIVIAVLGGSAGGSLVTLLGSARKDGRRGRSEFLGPLAAVERARWSYASDTGYHDLLEAGRLLQGAAIVSGIPRAVIETYLAYAEHAYRNLREDYDLGNFEPGYGPGISTPLNNAVYEMAAIARDFAWRPIRARRGAAERIGAVNSEHDAERPNIFWGRATWPRHHVDV